MSPLFFKFDEYWQETANTRKPLIITRPKPKEAVLQSTVRTENLPLLPESFELIEERACILSSDMDLPLEWVQVIVKLRSILRPQKIPLKSWLEIQNACGKLYVNEFALLKLIINNGWLLADVYGCHESVPLARFDMMGLLLLLHQGDEVVSVNKHRIKILKKSGSKLVFSRRLDQQEKVGLLYEL